MFIILDGREHFYQWDLNQKLIVDNPEVKEVHFSNIFTEDALVVEVKDGLVDVPNILLQDNLSIRAYAYCGECRTLFEQSFEVLYKTKPADYVYTETEVKSYALLDERITALEQGEPKGIKDSEGSCAIAQAQGGVLNSDGLVTDESVAKGISSTALGARCVANGDSSLAAGYKAITYQVGSVALGSSTAGSKELQDEFQRAYWNAQATANDDSNLEEIYSLISEEDKQKKYGFAFAIGGGSEATGRQSFAGGYLCKAIGNQAVSLGRENTVNGESSTAFGYGNVITGAGTTSFITGYTNECSNQSTFCSGYKNKATEAQATALGRENTASGGQSLATGLQTTASGARAIAGGTGTKATGANSVALGSGSTVSGTNSLAIGGGVEIANNNQIACGVYNVAENKPFIIGNGNATNRKTIFSVDWSGNITIGSTTLTESKLKKLLALI